MAGTGDLADLYAASYQRLVVQLFAICGDLADAEDAVQEAFVTAIRKRRELARVYNPEAWVRTVALNRVRSGWRHSSVVRKYQAKTLVRRLRSRSDRTTSRSWPRWRSSTASSVR